MKQGIFSMQAGKSICLRDCFNKRALMLALVLGVSMTAKAALFVLGGDSWKEEILLHDGKKMIVKRSQIYGGRSEVGQSAPIKEHTIEFTLPSSRKSIKWVSEHAEDLGRANFNLLAVHVLNSTPYIVAEPNLCLSYNKWGRPNPPYVIFKYEGDAWTRIAMDAFPTEFRTVNVVLSIRGQEVKNLVNAGLIPAEKVGQLNQHVKPPELKSILREPLAREKIDAMCEQRVLYKGSWILPNDPVARKFIDSQKK